ncbi:MAG: FAD-binding protein [Armatimonadota bacterium]
MYDLAIIGGGPAGAMLARLAGGRMRVLLVERRRLDRAPGGVGKCCGGLLAPDAQQVLAELGLGVPLSVLSGPQLFVVRSIDAERGLERYYQRFYLNCDRELFDHWLVSLAPGGVAMRFGCQLQGLEPREDSVELTLRDGERACTEHARLVVGADGANSPVRRLAFPAHPRPKVYLGLQEWYRADAPLPYFSAIFDRAVTDFYAWTIPKGDHLIVGAALQPHTDTAGKMARLREVLAAHGMPLGQPIRREGALLFRPERVGQLCPGGGHVALLGEAAGWISPSSAEGLSYAFRSAIALADALRDGPDGASARYRAATASLRRNIALKLLKSPFMYAPWLRGVIMRSGVQGIVIRDENM